MDLLIGNKQEFAIEVGNYKKDRQTGKLRFWINSQDFGILKKSDKLSYAIRSLKEIMDEHLSLYDDSFDGKTNEEVFEIALVLDIEIGSLTDEDYERMERYQKFSFNFGGQFDDVSHIIYAKDGQCIFLWSTHTDRSAVKIDYLKGLKQGSVSLDTLSTVLKEFLEVLNK